MSLAGARAMGSSEDGRDARNDGLQSLEQVLAYMDGTTALDQRIHKRKTACGTGAREIPDW